MEAHDGKIDNESPKNNHSLHFEKCLSKDLDDSTSRTQIQSRQRKHRYKNTLHLWEFLLELLADESCKSIICWRRKEYGEFQLIDHHEVAKRWGQLKKRNDMNYSKLSRALRLYYQQGIITKVKGQMLVYKFYKLPYEYEPGVTRSIYREKFLGQYTSYQGSLPQRQKAGEASPQRNTETLASTSFFYPTIAPCGNFITHSVSSLPRQAFWFPDPVPCTSLRCFSRSRIFFPVLSPAHTISMMTPSGKENFTAANLFVNHLTEGFIFP